MSAKNYWRLIKLYKPYKPECNYKKIKNYIIKMFFI